MVDFESMRAIPLRLWVIAILSGVVQALSFPIAGSAPLWRSALCWVALAPLLMALTGKDANGRPLSAIQGATLGYCSGFVWHLGNCYWIYPTMHAYGGIARPVSAGILVLFCLYLGLYHALFGTLIAVLRRGRLGVQGALLVSPFAWVAVELARARITSFPWDQLGVAQVDNPLLTRLGPYTGVYGLSFVIAAVNALWLTRISLKDRRYTRTGLTVVGVAIVLLYVVFLRHTQRPVSEGTSATAVLVQENIGVGAAAAAAGPELSIGQELSTFSSLSLFPLNGEVCYGMPEVSSTKCVSALSPHQGNSPDQTRYLAQTDVIVWPEAPNRFVDTYLDPAVSTPTHFIPQYLHLYVEDVDATFKRAVEAGVKVDMPLEDMFWGDRYGKFNDPFGQQWSVASHKEDVAPDEMKRRMQALFAKSAGQN